MYIYISVPIHLDLPLVHIDLPHPFNLHVVFHNVNIL